MAHYHFIVNPAAGGNFCLHRFRTAQSMLDRLNVDYSVVYSEYAGHASQLAQQAVMAGRDIVVAVGGDGTVREVAGELAHTGVPMGILPCGTGNDMIKALRIPDDTVLALELLLAGNTRPIDAALVNDQLYINVAGLGFDVEVLDKTRYYKNRFRGSFAYLLGVLSALLHLKTYQIHLEADDRVIDRDVLLVSVGNGNCIGGGMMVTPKADPADGLLDVCVVRGVGRLKVLHCLTRFMRGGHLELDIVEYFQTDRLSLTCAPDTPVQLDGEIIGRTPVELKIQPAAIQIIS